MDHHRDANADPGVARKLAEVLSGLARGVRVPTAIVALLPVLPALFLLALAVVTDGTFAMATLAVGVVGLGLALWLWVRRSQMQRAAQPVDALADDIAYAADASAAWDSAEEAWRRIQAIRDDDGWGLIRAGRAALVGLELHGDLTERVTERPRLAPFKPTRMQGMINLSIACGIVTVVSIGLCLAGLVLLTVT